MTAIADSKRCSKCGCTKLFTDFAKHSTKPDGLQTWCRPCKIEVQRELRSRPPKDPNAPPPPAPAYRACTKCGVTKPLFEFGKAKDEAFGHSNRCKACAAEHGRQHYLAVRKAKKFIITVEQKSCPRCAETKPACLFVASPHRSDGLSKHCQVCDKAARDERGHYRKRKLEDPEYGRERGRLWRAQNLELARELDRQAAKDARKRKPEVFREIGARKRAELVRAKPAWADVKAMRAVYREAQRLEKKDGIKRHVDHIVPLRSKLVCGLHVHQNLQILTGEENLRKTNKFEVQ